MKTLLKVVLGIVLLVVVLVVALFLFRNTIATSVANSAAPAVLGVDAHVGALELNISPPGATVRDLEVGNPKGYEPPKSITAGKIDLQIGAETTAQKIVVDLLELDDVGVWFVANGTKNNISDIIDGMGKGKSSGGGGGGTQIEVLIKRFVLTKVDVHASAGVGIGPNVPVAATIDRLELTNISTKAVGDGMIAQLVGPIFESTMSAVVGQVGGQLPGEIAKSVGSSLQDAGAVAGKAAEALGNAAKDAGKAAGDAAKGATDALKGLGDALGGKK
ncbi:MAG: hypothetical protein U0625_06425 [Phycisphaerales bacterium]